MANITASITVDMASTASTVIKRKRVPNTLPGTFLGSDTDNA